MRTRRLAQAVAVLVSAIALGSGAAVAVDDPHTDPRIPSTDPRIKDELLGLLAIEPSSGTIETYMEVTTAGGCPGGTNSITSIFGQGFPMYGENVIGNTEVFEFMDDVPGRMVAPLTITLDEAMKRQPERPRSLDGLYRLVFTCQEPLPTSFDMLHGYYEGYVEFTQNSYTVITKPADLPEVPTPEAGPAALAGPSAAAVDLEQAEQDAVEAQRAALAVNQPREDVGGAPVWAAAAVGGILLAAGGSVVLARRQSSAGGTGRGRS